MSKFTDIMIDIETLSSSPRAAVIQIGACAFNLRTGETGPVFQTLVRPNLAHSEISVSTVAWWMQQDEAARSHVARCDREGNGEASALLSLNAFWATHAAHDACAWAMPPEFDLVILRNLYDANGLAMPWHFAMTRDLRTLEYLAGGSKDQRVKPKTAHNAADDAFAQAETAISYYRSWLKQRD